MLDIKYDLKEAKSPILIEGRTGSILVNNKIIGHLGETNPETLNNWNLKLPVSILEINLDEITSLI
jgi:phenylalanyl-tRNA synthetase beta chain